MNISAGIQIGARFKLVAHKGDVDNPTKETGWIKNLVLDSGLNRLSVGNAITHVAVGTGNSTPSVTQTGLDNVLVTTTSITGADVALSNTTTAPYYYGARRTYRFGLGAAAGNLTEVGIGWGTTQMFNRTLIKDSLGNPTTITILSDEYLDIVVEIRHYPQQSFTGSFNLLNKLGEVVSTHTVDGTCLIGDAGVFALDQVNMGGQLSLYTGSANLGSVTSTPSGTLDVTYSQERTYPTPNSLRTVWTIGLGQANFTIRSVELSTYGLCNNTPFIGYKFQITPPIPKNNTQIMALTLNLSWTRYTGV